GLCGSRGLRTASLSVGATALLNLGLSFMAMRLGKIGGLAFATVLSQTILGICMTRVTSRYLGISFLKWTARACLLPASLMPVLYWIHLAGCKWGQGGVALSLVVIGAAIIGYARVSGVGPDLLAQ